MSTPHLVSQNDQPCALHASHRPVTIVNEMHHELPQEWQREIWGEIRNDKTVSICATGHNNVHAAIQHYLKHDSFPDWCIGKTRNLAQRAFDLRDEAANSNQ